MLVLLGLMCVGTGSPLAAPALKEKPPIPAGVWTVKYHPNQATRVYVVDENGDVAFPDADADAKIKPMIEKNGEILIDFKDGKLERWTIGKDGRLFIEHFNPKESYPHTPDQIGIGTRKDAKK